MADTKYAEQLSPLDLLMPKTYIRVLFVFEHLDSTNAAIQTLQPGLDKLYKQIPWLSGRVFPAQSDQEKAASPKIRWDVNTTPNIVDKGTIATSYEWASTHGMPGDAISSDVWPVSDIIDTPCLVTGAPVFASSIFRFAGRGAGLCVCLHHHVVDADGFSEVVQLWSQNIIGQNVSSLSFESRNARLCEALSRDLQATVSDSTECLLNRHPEFSTTPPVLPESFHPSTSKVFAIPIHWIDVLRELMQEYTPKRPSTNTVICALIWTSITRARAKHNPSLKGKPSNLAMAVNGRQRIAPTFSTPDAPFFGNAVTYSLSQLPASDLAAADKTPVRELAKICDHISHLQSGSVINSRHIAEVHTLAERMGHQSLFVGWDLFGSRDLTITSWAGFDLYKVYFGEVLGRPKFVRMPYMEADGVGIILPRQRSVPDEVLEVMVMLRRDHMESLEMDPMWETLCSRGGAGGEKLA